MLYSGIEFSNSERERLELLCPDGAGGEILVDLAEYDFTRSGVRGAHSVEFDPSVLPWADFRGKVLGPTDPAKAPADSLRGTRFTDWEALGLAAAPNTGDNGVHALASPL